MVEPSYRIGLGSYIFEVYPQKPPFEVHSIRQVHGNAVVQDTDALPTDPADGIYSLALGRPLAVRSADCMPVAVIGGKGIALLHIGWRGLKAGIVGNAHIARIAPRRFFMGPHISGRSFEVTSEFRGHFPRSRHFHASGGRLFFSLEDELSDLIGRSFPEAAVGRAGLCTYEDVRFHSFRRNAGLNRNWNVLKIP